MNVSISTITLFAFIPALVSFIGGVLALYTLPKGRNVAWIQHFVAGIVIGAVSIELIPEIIGKNSSWMIGIGFVLGAATMIGVHQFSHFLSAKEGSEKFPLGTVVGSALDLLIDGILIGVAFLAGEGSGVVIALSLSLCALFLNMAVGSTLEKKNVGKSAQFIVLLLIPLMLPLGAFIGSALISQLPPIILVETIAFGVAALLFLGVEELLAEAHGEGHDTVSVSSAFFLGFLVIILFRV